MLPKSFPQLVGLRFHVEVIGVRCPEAAPREIAEGLFLFASMDSIAVYLCEFEAEATEHA